MIARFTKPSNYDRFLRNDYAILDFDARSELLKITCPTLIIAGSDDRTVGNDAAIELNRGINGSEMFVYDGLGHGAYEEAKDFYTRVFEFCNLGIGTALTDASIECAGNAGYEQIELSVVAENETAIRMYGKAGFEEYGRNPRGFKFRNKGYQELVYMRMEL